MKKIFIAGLIFFCSVLAAQDKDLTFEEYDPPSTLVVPEHLVERAKYPFVDVHNHQFRMPDQDLSELTKEMDKMNMTVMVNLSGRGFKMISENPRRYGLQGPEYLKRAVENVRENYPNRFIVFTNVDFNGIDEPGWSERAVNELETDYNNGARGLKIYKSLGFMIKDSDGNFVRVDDPRIDPVWEKCGELGIPVLIHTADPASFWEPFDKNNERWLELKLKPNRKRNPETEPSFEELIEQQHNVFRKHKNTKFINAHLGWLGNDLARLGKLFDECPNVYTEIGAVLYEIGRQPRFAREFFIKYQDRIMFGKDSWRPEEYPYYFRVLETADEYFDYYRRYHAFWKLYGIDLPDEVLKKIYYKNALNVIPGIDKTLFPD